MVQYVLLQWINEHKVCYFVSVDFPEALAGWQRHLLVTEQEVQTDDITLSWDGNWR